MKAKNRNLKDEGNIEIMSLWILNLMTWGKKNYQHILRCDVQVHKMNKQFYQQKINKYNKDLKNSYFPMHGVGVFYLLQSVSAFSCRIGLTMTYIYFIYMSL